MKKRKTLQDLTIKDNFMFGAVMSVEENCKGFLEMVLGFPIARVVVSKEKSMIIIRSTRASVWIFMLRMPNTLTIMWKCRCAGKRRLEKEAGITIARL